MQTLRGIAAGVRLITLLPWGGFCAANMLRTLTERVEVLSERCARYAEEIMVLQEKAHEEAEAALKRASQ